MHRWWGDANDQHNHQVLRHFHDAFEPVRHLRMKSSMRLGCSPAKPTPSRSLCVCVL
jgi:hypothetical protein